MWTSFYNLQYSATSFTRILTGLSSVEIVFGAPHGVFNNRIIAIDFDDFEVFFFGTSYGCDYPHYRGDSGNYTYCKRWIG